MGEPKTGFSSLHVPLCLAGKRHRIQSCEKPPAQFNWRLTRLLTRVAGETVAKAVWAVAQPESPHAHRHTCTCTHIPFLFATTYYDRVQDTLRQNQRGFGVIFETSNDLLSKLRAKMHEGGQLHRQTANDVTIVKGYKDQRFAKALDTG